MRESEHLLEGVRERLITGLNNFDRSDKSIKITVSNNVDAGAGKEFINIYKASVSNVNPLSAMITREVHSITIGVTRRLVGVPLDRVGHRLLTKEDKINLLKPSLLQRVGEINELIDNSYDLLKIVNDRISEAGDGEHFLIPLALDSDSGEVDWVEEDHFFNDESGGDRPEGIYTELVFSNAQLFRVR